MTLKLLFLLIMAIGMIASGIIVIYLGYKRRTQNKLLWALVPMSRGFEWLIEFASDYLDVMMGVQDVLDSYELSLAFLASLVVVAACLEFNGVVPRPLGKVLAILMGLVPIFLLLTVDFEVMSEIEDFLLYEGQGIEIEPFRFLYGFLILITSAILLLITHLYYIREVKRDKIPKDEKMHLKVAIMIGIIVVSSIFMGIDYEETFEMELLFTSFRAITMIPFIMLPLIVILSSKADLHLFIITKNSGIPIYAYDFKEDAESMGDDMIFLTSGFLSALTSFSGELTSRRTDTTIIIRSSNLYYLVFRTDYNIYALQASYQNQQLENMFNQVVEKLDKTIKNRDAMSAFEEIETKNLLRTSFAEFI